MPPSAKRLCDLAERNKAGSYCRLRDSHAFDRHAAKGDSSLVRRINDMEQKSPDSRKSVSGYASRDDLESVVNYMILENARRITREWDDAEVGEDITIRRDPFRDPNDFATAMLDSTPAIGIHQPGPPSSRIPTKSTRHVLVLKKQPGEPWFTVVTVYADMTPADRDPDPRRLLNGGPGVEFRSAPKARPQKTMGDAPASLSAMSAGERRAARKAQREAAARERRGSFSADAPERPRRKAPAPEVLDPPDDPLADEPVFEVVNEADLGPEDSLFPPRKTLHGDTRPRTVPAPKNKTRADAEESPDL